jgi:type IV pilus assembly protein PilM
VAACAERLVPAGTSGAQADEEVRRQLVKDMLEEVAFVGRDAVASLGWDELRVRNVRVPPMPEKDMEQAVRFAALERLGLDDQDAAVRFQIAGDVRQGTDLQQEVIVFGTRASTVDARIAALTQMGLSPVALDAGPCAMFRAFDRFLRRGADTNRVNAFLDLGYTGARVVISRGPDPVFFKSIPVGGQRFDELVSESLNLSLDEAARLRLRLHRQHVAEITGQPLASAEDGPVGENIRRAIQDALRPALEQLGKEIGLCLRYCAVTFRGMRADAVTVVGGEACDADTLRVLSDQVRVAFQVGKPMRNLATEQAAGAADRRTGQPEWATALGLALKAARLGAEVAA